MMRTKDKPLAFTLAEALMTIAIIGVVMSLMSRAITRVSPDKEKIQFIKTYHAIESVIADTINDPTKYDQNYYSEADIENMTDDEKKALHIDFAYEPLKSAKVVVNGETIYSCEHKEANQNKCINRDTAMCYFLADGLNTKFVDCETQNTKNIETTTGSCIHNLVGVENDGSNTPTIVPLCNGSTYKNDDEKNILKNHYVIMIYHDGKLTVPEHWEWVDDQEKAYKWLDDQTNVK